jgi:hypothetical protein
MAKANQPWGVKYDLTHITEEINFWQQKLAEAAALEKHAWSRTPFAIPKTNYGSVKRRKEGLTILRSLFRIPLLS